MEVSTLGAGLKRAPQKIMDTTNTVADAAQRVLSVLMPALLTASLALTGWTLKEVVDLKTEAAKMGVRQANITAIANMNSVRLQKLEGRVATIPSTIPPEWLLKRIDKLEVQLDRIETRITSK